MTINCTTRNGYQGATQYERAVAIVNMEQVLRVAIEVFKDNSLAAAIISDLDLFHVVEHYINYIKEERAIGNTPVPDTAANILVERTIGDHDDGASFGIARIYTMMDLLFRASCNSNVGELIISDLDTIDYSWERGVWSCMVVYKKAQSFLR